jgi:putative ABC transport system permease protein
MSRSELIEPVRRVGRRLRLLMRRGAAERAMNAELRHHIECETAERMREGLSYDAARQQALVAFGNVETVKELSRDARGTRTLEELATDIRYAWRHLVRHPGFAIAASGTLALGAGAVAAIYSLVYGILLRPLPYADPDRLMVVWERNVPRDRDQNVVSLDNFVAWRERATAFERMAAVIPTSATIDGEPAAERVTGADVTAGYFSVLGVPPALGRDFDASESLTGQAVILSDALWKRRFGADPSVVGRPIAFSGRSFVVVGVMPADFDPPRVSWLGRQELWFPLVDSAQSRSWGRSLIVLGRLRDGVSLQAARDEMLAIAAQRARESPANAEWSASVIPLSEEIIGSVSTSLCALLAAVCLLFCMATVNVTTLSLAMLERRQEELAMRRAIGATDNRLFRQLFAQSALLGASGAVAGATLAIPATALLVSLLPADVPRAGSIAVDGPVLLATGAIALAATMALGAIVAARGCRLAHSPLSVSGPASRTSPMTTGGGSLTAANIALAVALSVMAVLMGRTYSSLQRVDLGFEPDGVMVARVALPSAAYPNAARQRAFFGDLIGRVGGIPGVTAAGLVSARPFAGMGPATPARDAASPPAPPGEDPVADVRYADAGFFAALGVQRTAGELFDDRRTGPPLSALVTSSLARQLWPGHDPVGQRLALDMNGGIEPIVAGVIKDLHLIDARTLSRPAIFLSAGSFPSTVFDVVMRIDGEPEAVLAALRTAVGNIDAGVPVYMVDALSRIVDEGLAADRLTSWLLAVFASVALSLAAVGVFAVYAADVTRRRKEIGIRLALGGPTASILGLLFTTSLRHTMVGVTTGWVLAWILGRGMESLLFDVAAADAWSFAVAGAAAAAISLAATWIPARNALRASPLDSLREQ